jgi:Icc-related predicted phosphoesterase
MTDFQVPVHTMIPAEQFKKLRTIAQTQKVDVGVVIARLVRKQLARGGGMHDVRSGYTTAKAERLVELRRLNRSYAEAGGELGVSSRTAQEWMRRYEAEMRSRTINAVNNPKGSTK